MPLFALTQTDVRSPLEVNRTPVDGLAAGRQRPPLWGRACGRLRVGLLRHVAWVPLRRTHGIPTEDSPPFRSDPELTPRIFLRKGRAGAGDGRPQFGHTAMTLEQAACRDRGLIGIALASPTHRESLVRPLRH